MKSEDSSEQQNLWTRLEARADEARPQASNLWATIRQRLEFSNLKPKGVSTVEVAQQQIHGEKYYILHNTALDTYIQLDSKGLFVWNLMDGQHSLTDICVAYLLEYGSPPFEQFGEMLVQLRSKSFLEEKTPNLYGLVWQHFGAQSFKNRLAELWKKASRFQISINADGYFNWLYYHGGWLLFTNPAKIFYLILSVVGIALFVRVFIQGNYPIALVAGSYDLGIVTLYLINTVIIIVHEHAHGLTCKAYGRKVLSGGLMIYWGQPALYVDTTDMWLSSRRGRMAVTWAGPYSGVLVASVCTLINTFLPSSVAAPLLFQVAFMGILSAVINMNPLLEWDGYYILINFLEIPRLRAKSFDFIKGPLWHKLSAHKSKFSREEKIYTVFGAMAVIWGLVAILLAVQMWQSGIFNMLKSFWESDWFGSKIILAIIGLAIIVPLVGSMGLKIWQGLAELWQAILKILTRKGGIS